MISSSAATLSKICFSAMVRIYGNMDLQLHDIKDYPKGWESHSSYSINMSIQLLNNVVDNTVSK